MLFFMISIYFAGSIAGGRENIRLYGQIIEHLKKYGKVLTEHIGDKKLSTLGETNLSDSEIYERDTDLLYLANVVVAEVTTPSLGVGFEIGRALERNKWLAKTFGAYGKRILCLHRPSDRRRLSAMIAGCEDLTLREYANIEEARKHIDDFFKR